MSQRGQGRGSARCARFSGFFPRLPYHRRGPSKMARSLSVPRAHREQTRDDLGLELFDRTAPDYALSHNRLDMVERSRIFGRWIERASAAVRGRGTCLDIGCGTGLLSLAAAQAGFQVTGIDGSRSMLAAAAANGRAAGVDLRLQLATVPLADSVLASYSGTADLVIASSLIEFVRDAQSLIDQCRRMLAPGGIALLSFANKASVLRMPERARKRWRDLEQALTRTSSLAATQHLHEEEEARDLFRNSGLQVVGVDYFALPHWAYPMWRSPKRPSRLATLFLLAGRALTPGGDTGRNRLF
jgi:2-polyprenyl-3-methyl-5-hydroxy-6-metoxy-1,4-benzoquinol methylase